VWIRLVEEWKILRAQPSAGTLEGRI